MSIVHFGRLPAMMLKERPTDVKSTEHDIIAGPGRHDWHMRQKQAGDQCNRNLQGSQTVPQGQVSTGPATKACGSRGTHENSLCIEPPMCKVSDGPAAQARAA